MNERDPTTTTIAGLQELLTGLAPSDPRRATLAAELVRHLGGSGRFDEAMRCASETLRALSDHPPDPRIGRLLLATSSIHVAQGRGADARRFAESALAMLRGHDPDGEICARIELVRLGTASRDAALVDQHLPVLDTLTSAPGHPAAFEVACLAASVARLRADRPRHREALAKAVASAQTTDDRLLAQLALTYAEPPDAARIAALCLEAMMHAGSLQLQAMVDEIGADQDLSLTADVRAQLARSAETAQRFSAAAHILMAADDREAAQRLLTRARALPLAPLERRRCTHLLMTLLPRRSVAERKPLVRELEHQLAALGEDVALRLDLAIAIHADAGNDVDALRTAWRHGYVCLQQATNRATVAVVHGALGPICADLLPALAIRSTEELGEAAAWLTDELLLPDDEARRLRGWAIRKLGSAGPFTHPSVRQVNERLRAVIDVDVPRDSPFDAAPSWLVALVDGQPYEVTADELATHAGLVRAVFQLRPDAESRLIALVQRPRSAASASTQRVLGHLAHDLHASPASPKAPAPIPATSADEAIELFEHGVASMRACHGAPPDPEAAALISEARRCLAEAVRYGRKHKKKQLPVFDFLVSLGNAWRMGPDDDVERALGHYAEAEKLDAPPLQRAKLWKVRAEALLLRGRPDDLRQAARLAERSLGVRRGRDRAATLWVAARVAAAHPDLDALTRHVRALEQVLAAVREDREAGEALLHFAAEQIRAIEALQPGDARAASGRAELIDAYPTQRLLIETGTTPLESLLEGPMGRVFEHPAFLRYSEVARRLLSVTTRSTDTHGLLENMPAELRAQIITEGEAQSLLGDTSALERALVTDLARWDDAQTAPGAATARALLIAHLARLKRRNRDEAWQATIAAVAQIELMDDALVRAVMLRQVATIWCPEDHANDPIADFGWAADLLARAIEAAGGEDEADDDLLGARARALRYSRSGNLAHNLRESRRIRRIELERVRHTGVPDSIAHTLDSLAEVESQIAEGPRLSQLQRTEALSAEAAQTARSPRLRAKFLGNLAWNRTQLAFHLPPAQAEAALRSALETFDAVDLAQLEPGNRENVGHNRTACAAELARRQGDVQGSADLWRERLLSLDAAAQPYSAATARHNLAVHLVSEDDLSEEQVVEALAHLEAAAEVRTLEANARHYWETCLEAGRILWRVRERRWAPEAWWSRAAHWLRRAVTAARTLGPGEELATAGQWLGRLALEAPDTPSAIEIAESAWSAWSDATPYLLRQLASAEESARLARDIAVALAYRLGAETTPPDDGDLAFVLRDQAAEIVERWLLRAQLPQRLRLQARLARPSRVSIEAWLDWQAALASDDDQRIARALDGLRAVEPKFLTSDPTMAETWRWLATRPGSVAVLTVCEAPVILALVLRVHSGGECESAVVGLSVPAPDCAWAGVITELRQLVDEPSPHLDTFTDWARACVVAPVIRWSGTAPTELLWCPDATLRALAPSALWPGTAVSCTLSIDLPDLGSAPSRRPSTLLVLADPEQSGADRLHDHGVDALVQLSAAASEFGPLRVLASVGARHGRALLEDAAHVREGPASARNVLFEAADHAVIVILAHGDVPNPDDAALLCVAADGGMDRLDVARLAEEPDRFTGAQVILLACESGRTGAAAAHPGGLAGTLICAGARSVVAPIRPVDLTAALTVGQALLRGLREGQSAADVLACAPHDGAAGGPQLGPPRPLADQQRRRLLGATPFVSWIG